MDRDPFKEYLKESEPDKVYKGYVWSTAIGLQAVDRLNPSEYLIDTASGRETRAPQPGFSHKLLKKCDFAVK